MGVWTGTESATGRISLVTPGIGDPKHVRPVEHERAETHPNEMWCPSEPRETVDNR
jgi:hypothetical protein